MLAGFAAKRAQDIPTIVKICLCTKKKKKGISFNFKICFCTKKGIPIKILLQRLIFFNKRFLPFGLGVAEATPLRPVGDGFGHHQWPNPFGGGLATPTGPYGWQRHIHVQKCGSRPPPVAKIRPPLCPKMWWLATFLLFIFVFNLLLFCF
jgi:hypothetical protein